MSTNFEKKRGFASSSIEIWSEQSSRKYLLCDGLFITQLRFGCLAFAAAQNQKVPRSKAALDTLVGQKRLLPADNDTYRLWEPHNEESMTLAFEPRPRLFPAYVAPLNLPKMDNRFKGKDAPNTQLIEAYLMGYRFWVLSDGFVITKIFGHRMPKSTELAQSQRRSRSQSADDLSAAEEFKSELRGRYPFVEEILWSHDSLKLIEKQ